MMSFDVLGERFIGMFKEKSENGIVLRLEVDFKSNVSGLEWTVFNGRGFDKDGEEGIEEIIFVIPKDKNNVGIYHVLGMEGKVSFDDLIKHSKLIIDTNMEVEEKKMLFRDKMNELSDLFQKHSIDILRDLHFTFTKTLPAKQPDKQKKRRKKTVIETDMCIGDNQ